MIRRTFPTRPLLRWTLTVLALLGALCAVILLARRVRAELASGEAACAVTWEDVRILAAADGRSAEQWLADLRAAGVAFLVAGENDGSEAAAAAARAGMRSASMGSTARDGDAFLVPAIRDGTPDAQPLDLARCPCLACVEDLARTALLLPADVTADALACPAVKTLYMFGRYRLFSAEDAPYSEPCNILFRAVTERGIRLILLSPLEDENGVVADPFVYTKLLTDLAARLSPRGITFGDAFTALEAPAANRWLLAGALLLVACWAVILLQLAVPGLPAWVPAVLLPVGALAAAGLALLRSGLAMTLGAFAAAVLGGCGAARVLHAAWRDEALSERPAFALYATVLLRLLLCGVLSGLCVAALLSCREYMLGFTVFRGVKAAQAAPLLAAALALLQAFRAERTALFPTGKRRVAAGIALVLILALAAAILLLRSGDAGGFVSGLELRFRNALERRLFVRPRSKEMLLAVPAAALFALCRRRSLPLPGLVFGVLAALETVSVINSFCHIVTPLHVTLIRTALGALIGFAIGAVLCLILSLPLRSKPR